jgi:hypothetical protein
VIQGTDFWFGDEEGGNRDVDVGWRIDRVFPL